MNKILVHQIDIKLNFLEATLNAFYDRPDFSNKAVLIFKKLNAYLELAAEKESGEAYKQSYSDKINLLFNRQGSFITGVDKDAVQLIHHFLSSSTNIIESILRHDIGMNEVMPLTSRIAMMSKITQTVDEHNQYAEVDCECHNKPFRDYLGKGQRSEMSYDEMYQYYIVHAAHSPNTKNCIAVAGLIRYIEKNTWHDSETALEVVQRLHSCNRTITGDELLDSAINTIISDCLIGIPR